MAGVTERFGFTTINRTLDDLSLRDYQFGDHDRRRLEELLIYALEAHRHNGADPASNLVTTGPVTQLVASGGHLPASATVYYRWSLVDPRGHESVASAITPVVVPAPAVNPAAGDGFRIEAYDEPFASKLPGRYSYRLAGYAGDLSAETLPGQVAVLTVTAGHGIRVHPPIVIPSGVEGWNVYRQGPTDERFYYIGSITTDPLNDLGLPATTRSLPTANTTNTHFAISAVMPATPGLDPGNVPDGHTWKLYRTFNPTVWTNSLVCWSAGGSFYDPGDASRPGHPLESDSGPGAPSPIQLTDGAHAGGTLPPGNVATPVEVTFAFPGAFDVSNEGGAGNFVWVCEYQQAIVYGWRASLGLGFAPASDPVRARLRLWTGTEWEDLSPLAEVPVGETFGAWTACVPFVLNRGQALTVAITQTGGGATPTDQNLLVGVSVIARGAIAGDDLISETWP